MEHKQDYIRWLRGKVGHEKIILIFRRNTGVELVFFRE